MKKLWLLILIVSFCSPAFATKKSHSLNLEDQSGETEYSSKVKTVGVGLVLGAPLGFTSHFNFSDRNSLHASLSFLAHFVSLYTDFTWNFPNPKPFNPPYRSQFTPYVGAGLILGRDLGFAYDYASYGTGVALRFPLGLKWKTPAIRGFEFFGELAPGLSIAGGGLWALFQIAIGGVYYF